ncbi:antibiotic biosynthesis monooxygenase family protein [Mesorhizobium xinjiangense]|uniref:antibiotic biosynthesis monooxygenase family protein n=1 Tax=Mesorhizobium xinjiangense TaxID=2678685 RepID=UPI0012EEC990|nr:antibiotic biosynthesis monooxygenase [Mesorhizobium xinjiangense]
MSTGNGSGGNRRHVYRVDKFIVPQDARETFLDRVGTTHDILRRQDGFVQDFILEQDSGPGRYNFVTLVEWESEADVENAAAQVARAHAETRFDRKAMMDRLGIVADIANYGQLASVAAQRDEHAFASNGNV